MGYKIYAPKPMSDESMEMLRKKGFEIIGEWQDSREDMKKYMAEADVVIARVHFFDDELLALAKNLKLIQVHGVGYAWGLFPVPAPPPPNPCSFSHQHSPHLPGTPPRGVPPREPRGRSAAPRSGRLRRPAGRPESSPSAPTKKGRGLPLPPQVAALPQMKQQCRPQRGQQQPPEPKNLQSGIHRRQGRQRV